jgi:ribosomal 50S subunit-associated protein YjgA (DUF615 family)
LTEQFSGSAQENLVLHQSETWRDRLIAFDDAFGEWIATFAEPPIRSSCAP